jgi:hypothetical protein
MKQSVNLSLSEFLAAAAFRKQANEFLTVVLHKQADEIRAFRIQEIFQLLHEACQQLEKMLSGITDAFIITLEILSNLDRTQIALLSSTIVLSRHEVSALIELPKSENWKDEEKIAFCQKFTRFMPGGGWYEEDILNIWEKFFKVSQLENE